MKQNKRALIGLIIIKQNDTYGLEHKQIQKAMTQDTPVKSANNSAYIDNIIAYDKEVQTRLDLGQNSLPGAQLYITGRPAIDIRLPDKDIMTSIIGLTDQRKMAKQTGTQDMIPQLDTM